MNRHINLTVLALVLLAVPFSHGAVAIVIAMLWLAAVITRTARRLLPWMGADGELALVFGLAALGFGLALWRSQPAWPDLLVGWFLISALSLIGFAIARRLLRKRRQVVYSESGFVRHNDKKG
ncbi:MAG: hypothetical protein AXA67_02145 [Methylothermaceae bacteria B42]|nr:MAG: hypothetical protein AXA67_02145 [Methylothermaceae bacteria B42]HHJ40063.1 hypothetical protein [Methylothermaceae bacterium]